MNCYDQDDEDLVSLVKPMITDPDWNHPYNLTQPLDDSLQAKIDDEFDLSIEMEQNISNHWKMDSS